MVAEFTLEEANRMLDAQGYPPIKRLPADEAALTSWKRVVDARRELEAQGKISEGTLLAMSQFCHCLKCPSYPRAEMAVYCVHGKSAHEIVAINCKCPSCEVYKMGEMMGTDYYCMTGAPGKQLIKVGGAVGVAKRLLEKEIEKGNPGKRLPERLMSPPQYVGARQESVEVPEKVPGWG